MSKPLRPEQVSAALRFYEIAFAPISKQPATTDVEQTLERSESPPSPSNQQSESDSADRGTS